MKKRHLKQIFASFLISGAVLAGCSATDESKEEKEVVESNDTEEAKETETTEPTKIKAEDETAAFATMKEELGKAKEDQEVDWDLVLSTYQDNFKGSVDSVNGEIGTAIEAAIEGGKAGDLDANVARQLVDKLTQSYFYQVQKGLQKDVAAELEAENTESASTLFNEIKVLSEQVFLPTAEKRDGYYELAGEYSMVENITNGLAVQQEAIDNGNVDDFKVYAQLTDKSIYKSYYLAANSYAEKIAIGMEEGSDATELQIMQAEGYGFLQAISGSLSGGDEEAATKLNELFSLSTDASILNQEEISSLFIKSIVAKTTGYHEKTAGALEAGEETEAKVEAMEGNMFLNMLQVEVSKQLGEEQSVEVMAQAKSWFEAVESQDIDSAKQHSDAIVSVLTQLQ
ncbi:hypothetical protein [Bacillus sp. 2205SS5-2]|uniref:hypothetical protein n=1 Tax=Bacillus sp. 2205SS5-2 TaxID=3109031 RepID=UPI0030065EDC